MVIVFVTISLTLYYTELVLIFIEGNNGAELMDDTWILNTTVDMLCWEKLKLDFKPNARMYNTSNICPTGPAKGNHFDKMLFIISNY